MNVVDRQEGDSNCFNHRLGQDTEMMALEIDLLTSQDHMRGEKKICIRTLCPMLCNHLLLVYI